MGRIEGPGEDADELVGEASGTEGLEAASTLREQQLKRATSNAQRAEERRAREEALGVGLNAPDGPNESFRSRKMIETHHAKHVGDKAFHRLGVHIKQDDDGRVRA